MTRFSIPALTPLETCRDVFGLGSGLKHDGLAVMPDVNGDRFA
jgi:hypothetical protein